MFTNLKIFVESEKNELNYTQQFPCLQQTENVSTYTQWELGYKASILQSNWK